MFARPGSNVPTPCRRTATTLDPSAPELLERYVHAFERYDVDALVQLLHEDATPAMPPHDLWLRGSVHIAAWFHAEGAACLGARPRAHERQRVTRLRPAPSGGRWHVRAVRACVLDVADGRIASIHAFIEPALVELIS